MVINMQRHGTSALLRYDGEVYSWHYGFGAAGIGMLIGLMIFLWGQKYLDGHAEPHMKLNWYPRWDLSETLLRIVEWHKLKDAHNNYRKLCLTQINDYMRGMNK